MANLRRGEIDAEIDGKTYTLCLTLGALAELEAAFEAADIVDLASRFEAGRLSARDLLKIIGCGLRGGGNAISNDEVAQLRVDNGLPGYAAIAVRLLNATFGPAEGSSGFPPLPQDPDV
ncbi:MAG: gene transfer agent family protein [Beijerinckiaceae bacterium]